MSDISKILAAEADEAEAVAEREEAAFGAPVVFMAKRFVLTGLCEKAAPVVPASQDSQQILKNFLFEVAPGSLRVTGSDLEMSILASSPSVVTESTASVVLPARRLRDLLREAPECDITITVTGDKAHIAAGPVSWDLHLYPDKNDFPAMPDLAVVTWDSVDRAAFLAAVRAVRHAIGRDGARPPLMMVSIAEGKVTASDGVRFQRATLEFPGTMQIPAAAVDHLLRIMGGSESSTVEVASEGNYLVFQVGSTVFLTHQLMARFPDMEKLMLRPALENKFELTCDRAALTEAVRRVAINADDATSAIGLRLKAGEVVVFSSDKSYNGAEQPVEAAWSGPDRLVVLNHEFLAAMLAAWPSPSCTFRLGADTGKRKSLILLSDEKTGLTGIIQQLHAQLLGYA